jgi:hypothetical protein
LRSARLAFVMLRFFWLLMLATGTSVLCVGLDGRLVEFLERRRRTPISQHGEAIGSAPTLPTRHR